MMNKKLKPSSSISFATQSAWQAEYRPTGEDLGMNRLSFGSCEGWDD
jgi:hypothetical protein